MQELFLSNNIVPRPNIILKASEHNIPLMLVKHETYQVAKQIDCMEAMLNVENIDKIDTLKKIVDNHINTNFFEKIPD